MSQPPNYIPDTDFSEQEANNVAGRSTVKTALLDAEFANVSASISATLNNLARIQRDDGEIADLMVKVPTLSQEVLNLIGGFRVRGLWEDFTEYKINDIATYGEYLYLCVQSHTSGATFNPSYWIQFGFSGAADAVQAAAQAQQSANNASASALSASTSATNAATSATNSANRATSASTSAYGALNSSNMAQQSATNSANSAAIAQAAAANLPNATAAGANKAVVSNSTATGFVYLNGAQLSALFGLALTANSVQKTGDTMTGPLVISGDLSTYRLTAPDTGVIFFGNSGKKYLYYDGYQYSLPEADLSVGGDVYASNVRLAKTTEMLGVGQTIKRNARVISTTYTNTSGKPIFVSILAEGTSGDCNVSITVNGVIRAKSRTSVAAGTPQSASACWIIPNGVTFSFAVGGATTHNIDEIS